jgi:hypothetical protein
MKSSITLRCNCGEEFSIPVAGSETLHTAVCPNCQMAGFACEPLSVSVDGDRLMNRSKAELEAGDYTLSIVCAAIAVESFLTRAFLKWKGVENLGRVGHLPTDAEEAEWEKEFPRGGGFLGPADFVSKALTGMEFDSFVTKNHAATKMISAIPGATGRSPKEFFQCTLFHRRNRIMHWGFLGYQRADAELCFKAAMSSVQILKLMDRQKFETNERAWRKKFDASMSAP